MHLVKSTFIKDNQPILIDCRYDMTNPPYGRQIYNEGHIEGAFYVDLDQDMTTSLSEHGGRHPLADLTKFTSKIGAFGIKQSSKVVIYDNGEFPMAARLWFMLKLIGIRQVFIAEGGYDQLRKDGLNVTTTIPEVVESQLTMDYQNTLLCDVEGIKTSMEDEKSVIVDSRSNPRYLGLEEPFDKIAGHIPTAINYFWKDNFDGNQVKNYGDLEAMYLEMSNFDEIIVHCGSGITGCVNMFFLNEIGIKSKLYLGSYSDWISYDNHDIVVKDNIIKKVNA